MNGKGGYPISRREFARRAAVASAASLVPASTLPMDSVSAQTLPQQPPDTPALSPENQEEAEARYQAILAVYGARFSDAQKSELRRLSFVAQPSLDHLRAYPIENGDSPALYLKPLIEREKNPAPVAISHVTHPSANGA
ncbi:MAG: hypothetical protein WBE13_17475 [Candidatus Acidiferrum sp.]